MTWKVIFSKQANKDAKKLSSVGLKPKAQEILAILEKNPYAPYPPFEKLTGDLEGYYSRRINIQHRLVYRIRKEERVVEVLQMWTHYE